MINMFEKDKIFIAPDLDINKLYEDGKEATFQTFYHLGFHND